MQVLGVALAFPEFPRDLRRNFETKRLAPEAHPKRPEHFYQALTSLLDYDYLSSHRNIAENKAVRAP